MSVRRPAPCRSQQSSPAASVVVTLRRIWTWRGAWTCTKVFSGVWQWAKRNARSATGCSERRPARGTRAGTVRQVAYLGASPPLGHCRGHQPRVTHAERGELVRQSATAAVHVTREGGVRTFSRPLGGPDRRHPVRSSRCRHLRPHHPGPTGGVALGLVFGRRASPAGPCSPRDGASEAEASALDERPSLGGC